MQWTDRIRQVKIWLVAAAIIIAVTSLLVSHLLVRDLQKEEQRKMDVWAQAMNFVNQADENTDLSLATAVIEGNNTIPVIVLSAEDEVMDYRNIEEDVDVQKYALRMKAAGDTIRIEVFDTYQLVCYDESTMLK